MRSSGSPIVLAEIRLLATAHCVASCWFWPAESLEHAPLPTTLAAPTEATQVEAARIAARLRFFHWELEFPDVFCKAGAGFDAIGAIPKAV